MTDNSFNDKDFDARLVRELSRLPSFTPSPGFGDRVMARVRLPQPRTVVLWRRARSWAMEPRRALALAGSYAALAGVALAYLVPWLLAHSAAIRMAADWTGTQVVGALREWLFAAAGWVASSGVADRVRALPIGPGGLVVAALGLTVAYGAGAIALRYLLRAPRRAHVASR